MRKRSRLTESSNQNTWINRWDCLGWELIGLGGELVALEKRVAGRLAVPSGDETFLSPQTCAKIQQRFAALKAEDHRRKKLPTRLESFFKHLVRNDESPDCKHFLEHMSGGIQLDHNTASRVIANYCDEEIRDFKETTQEICKIFDLKIEKKINIANRSKSENRHPILIYNEKNVPNNYTKIDAYQVDTMAIAPHRLKRDRNFLDAISYNRKDTNLLDVAKHSLNLSYIKLLEFCDRKIKFYDGKVQDEDAWAALLTIIMMQGFNLEVALLMKVRGDFGCSKVTIRSLKRRANNKLIKAEINEPYILGSRLNPSSLRQSPACLLRRCHSSRRWSAPLHTARRRRPRPSLRSTGRRGNKGTCLGNRPSPNRLCQHHYSGTGRTGCQRALGFHSRLAHDISSPQVRSVAFAERSNFQRMSLRRSAAQSTPHGQRCSNP